MGISNNGIGIRSGTKNVSNGNLSTQAVLPSNIKTIGEIVEPNRTVPAGGVITPNVVISPEKVSAARSTPSNPFSLSGNSTATTIAPTVKVSNVAKSRKEKIIQELSFKPDSLEISSNNILNDSFDIATIKGFSTQRPEIISLLDFKSIFQNQENLKFNDLGYFFDYKFQLIKLREQTNKNIQNLLENKPTIKSEYLRIKNEYNLFIAEEERKLKLIETLLNIFESIDKAFQPKELNKEYFKVNGLLPLDEFFIRKMNYKQESFNTFSDTKILYQLLFDLRSASEAYSINLLNLQDPDRLLDLNSVKIDSTYTRKNNFNFDINSLSTKLNGGLPKLGVQEDNFFNFLNSLPADSVDRSKLLIHTFVRILRVSKGLNKPNVKNLLTRVYSPSSDFNPFDNLLGTVPNDIFSNPLGTGTLSSTLLLNDSEIPEIKILPFENTIVDDGETKFVPGSIYFRNSLLRDFNSFSFIKFGDDFATKSTNMQTFYNETFDFYNSNNKLIPQTAFKQIIETVKNTVNNTTANTASPESLIIPAIFALANTDKVLKLYLFQFLLLLGMSKVTNDSNPELFKKLKVELKSTENLSAVDLKLDLTITGDQSSNIKLAATGLATKIGNYITEYLTQNSTIQLNSDGNFTTPIRTDGFSSFYLSNPGLITRTLTETISATASNKPNFFKDLIDLAMSFYENSKQFTVNEQSTLSSYLNVSLSYLLLLLFEGFCSLINRFVPIKFDVENGKLFGILYHIKFLKASNKAIEKLLNETSSLVSFATVSNVQYGNETQNQGALIPFGESLAFADQEYIRKFDDYYQNYKQIMVSLQDEDLFLQNILSIFDSISLNFNLVKRLVSNLFTSFSEQDKVFVNEHQGIINKTQYKISKSILDNAKTSMFVKDNLSENEFYHLLSFNNFSKSTDSRQKLLSIGIPYGFIDSLRGRLNKLSAISGEAQVVDYVVENTLIRINVYKRNLLDEEVVYKPKQFLFDLNLSVAAYDNNLEFDPYENFRLLNNLVQLNDQTSLKSKKITKQDFLILEKYNKLSTQEKEKLFENTIQSALLSKHIMLGTGFIQSEESFPVVPYRYTSDTQFIPIVNLYLSLFNLAPINSLNEFYLNPSVNSSIKDSVALLQKTMNSTNKNLLDSMIFTPKVFDKIFNVLINPIEFEIDEDMTPSRVLENESISKRIVKKGNSMFLELKNETIMDDYYVAIEVIE